MTDEQKLERLLAEKEGLKADYREQDKRSLILLETFKRERTDDTYSAYLEGLTEWRRARYALGRNAEKIQQTRKQIRTEQKFEQLLEENKTLCNELEDINREIAKWDRLFCENSEDYDEEQEASCLQRWQEVTEALRGNFRRIKMNRKRRVAMTFSQTVRDFLMVNPPFNEYRELETSWKQFKDSLAKKGQIHNVDRDSWECPCSVQTFKDFNAYFLGGR